MKAVLILPLLLVILAPVSGKTEVYIKLDKDLVANGELIRINVNVLCDPPSPVEILVAGASGGEWLYDSNGEKIEKLNETWEFQIPEDWQEGKYFVKVNILENSTTREFFEEFRVLKPKIIGVGVPEIPYQGSVWINVIVETPEEDKTSLSFRVIGANVKFNSNEEFKPYKNSTKLRLNLRELYEKSRSMDYALKPGIYAMELILKYGGKIYDSRILTFEVVKPRIAVSVAEEIVSGTPLRVSISTNRVNETSGAYNGIILTLVGENYRIVRLVELDDWGCANITLETAGLSEGDYRLYVRDTSLTLRGLDPKIFGFLYYDLDPKDPVAREYHAQDDVLVVKYLKIKNVDKSKPEQIIFLEPSDQNVIQGDFVDYKVLLSGAENGLSAYEIVLSISNQSVAKFLNIYTPEWAQEMRRIVNEDYIVLKALDIKGGVGKGAGRVELATVRLKAVSEGLTEISVRANRLNSDNGDSMNSYSYGAYLIVNPMPVEEINETEDLINSIGEFESEILEIQELEESHERISMEFLNSTILPYLDYSSSENKTKIPKPKEISIEVADLVLMAGTGLAFILVAGRNKFNG
ncbi:MAG: hypothetical protein QXU31_04475 [Archaeoglobaceae archaeon]